LCQTPSIEREQDGVQQPDRREIEAEPVGDERHIAEHPDDAQRDHLLHPESHEHHAGGEIADRIPDSLRVKLGASMDGNDRTDVQSDRAPGDRAPPP
jgi:hypothetical protein